jgi:hypothetical protein
MQLPPPLLVGWSLWVVGGVLLLLWFARQNGRPRLREVPPAHRLSPALAAAGRPLSATLAVARSEAGPGASGPSRPEATFTVRPPSGVYPVPFKAQAASMAAPPDPFDQLRALLDPPSDAPPHP